MQGETRKKLLDAVIAAHDEHEIALVARDGAKAAWESEATPLRKRIYIATENVYRQSRSVLNDAVSAYNNSI